MAGLNYSAFNSRPSGLTEEQIAKYKELGKKDLSDLINTIKDDFVPYNMQEEVFNIINDSVIENPDLVDSHFVDKLLSYFPTSYFRKELSMIAKNSPEVYRDNLDLLITKAKYGNIHNSRDLIEISTEIFGDDFFKEEKVEDTFKGNLTNAIVKSMYWKLDKDTFDSYFDYYLDEIDPEFIADLVIPRGFNGMSFITYLPKIMEKTNVNDRKAIFEVALLAENTKPEDLFDCVKNLRREDVTNIIYEFLNGEVNFQTVIDINFSPFSKTSYQNGLSDLISPEMKEKLLEVLDGATVDLFPDSDNKELKIFDDKHYEQDFLNLKNCFDAFIKDDKYELSDDDKKLLEYDYKNIVQIMSGDDKTLKHKQIENIIEHEEIIKDQIAKTKSSLLQRDISRDTKFKPFENVITAFEQDIVDDFYESIGINNKEFSANEALKDSNIRYGIEIEEVGVADTEFMDPEDYMIPGFSLVDECSLRKYRKDFENSVSFSNDQAGSEYVSDILSASSTEDLALVYTQLDVLKNQRARTNFSCGMHIHVSSPETLDENKNVANHVTREVRYIQDAIIDNFEVFPSRLGTHCKKIDSYFPDIYDRFKIVNLASLEKHGSVEFRYFNLPDSLDMKVLESYIDFATCYYKYMEDDNNFHHSCADFINENLDWLSDAPTSLKSQAIFAKLCDDIEIKDSTKKVLGRLPEIFDFYTAAEPGSSERYDIKNVSIEEELNGITTLESEEEKYDNGYVYDILFENALYDIAESELDENSSEYRSPTHYEGYDYEYDD